MTFAYATVLIAGLLPLVWVGYAKIAGGFDMRKNSEPRNFLGTLTGRAQRANWAQQNSWEAFAPFAAAVIIANLCHANLDMVDLFCGIFLVARLFYGACYIADLASLRSVAWFVGLISNIGLYFLAFRGIS